MDAQPELALIAKALNENSLEAILIGNMAAALHGAPVSTIDIDLFFRETPRNMQKLKLVADALDAVILRPYYPVSALFRLHRERDGLQIDFMAHIDGVKSYEGVRRRAGVHQIGGQKLLAASQEDITRGSAALKQKSDRALNRINPLPALAAAREAPQLPSAQDRAARHLPLISRRHACVRFATNSLVYELHKYMSLAICPPPGACSNQTITSVLTPG